MNDLYGLSSEITLIKATTRKFGGVKRLGINSVGKSPHRVKFSKAENLDSD